MHIFPTTIVRIQGKIPFALAKWDIPFSPLLVDEWTRREPYPLDVCGKADFLTALAPAC